MLTKPRVFRMTYAMTRQEILVVVGDGRVIPNRRCLCSYLKRESF